MATPTIDIGLLEYFSPILLFIVVFALIYSLFQTTKILGDSKVMHAVIAIITSMFITLMSDSLRAMVTFVIPWFTMLALIIVLSIMLYKVFGATDADIKSAVAKPEIYWTIFIIIVILILAAFSQAFGQKQLTLTEGDPNAATINDGSSNPSNIGVFNPGNPGTSNTASNDFNQNVGATFYHPKVLGTLLIFIISALAIAFLARPVYEG